MGSNMYFTTLIFYESYRRFYTKRTSKKIKHISTFGERLLLISDFAFGNVSTKIHPDYHVFLFPYSW